MQNKYEHITACLCAFFRHRFHFKIYDPKIFNFYDTWWWRLIQLCAHTFKTTIQCVRVYQRKKQKKMSGISNRKLIIGFDVRWPCMKNKNIIHIHHTVQDLYIYDTRERFFFTLSSSSLPSLDLWIFLAS